MNFETGIGKAIALYPETWEEAVAVMSRLPQYIFRGQASSSWGLSTNLERACLRNDFPTHFLDNREKVILNEFQRRAHLYIENPPPLGNKLEWYSLLQHYGGPTRLLDFTSSYYVAAFFAMEMAEDDAAIWALNVDCLYEHVDKPLGYNETIYELHKRSRDVVERNLSHQHSRKLVMAVEPERLNERISIQQGVFVLPGDLDFSFEDNLLTTLGMVRDDYDNLNKEPPWVAGDFRGVECFEHGLVKIILPLHMHNSALLELGRMNINAASLFPGLEGYARSLNGFLRDVV
ncbi:FRG domain-containing protein [Billgrantia diversa]|uniref:FRG domain-containing protein n=1 Tax=Halomonas sp. MCCC 1A13316 TaxID=2733487 RepID=UPI0018A640E5|nr:FRG domain-containing protein [Halomonas sp. MCCC 1A13316]QOR40209.1 FRG domain-containing protein [Halomonas sp. MCCC 1A13316]